MMIDYTKVPQPDPYGGGYGAGNNNNPGAGMPENDFNPDEIPKNPAYEWQEPYELPKWMKGANLWSDWGHTGNQVNPANVKQDWYRDPSWGGHIVFNPFYGWQDYTDVEKLYSQAEGPVSWQDFKGWGLDKQHSTDWRDFYDEKDYPVRGGEYWPTEEGGQGSGGNNDAWANWFKQFFSGGQPSTGPEEIGPVYDWLSPMNKATDIMGGIAESGSPVDYSGWWDANMPKMQRSIEDQSKNAAEMMGLGGMRWSTPLQRNITDITGRETGNAWSDFAKMSLGGQEQAKQRQLQAAGALPGISQAGYGIQSNIANALMGAGQGATNFNQQQLGNLLNLWGQNNPTLQTWLQSALGGMGQGGNFAQQMYSPGFWQQLFGGLFGGF